MTDILGFLGLILNLTSMAMKDVLHLRILSMIANSIYFVYGLIIGAMPIIVGSLIAVIIHAVYIYKLKHTKQVRLVNTK
ncbi:hypothetical protein [Ferruginibacter sp.]|nr:hypothetical protein [Ferruginibacter sp.]